MPEDGVRKTETEGTYMAKSISHAQWFLGSYCLGMKLRSLRTRKRMTLARLSAETGLSAALLSKLETDRMTPTLATMATLCRVYGVGLGYFFRDPETHSLSITRRVAAQGQGRTADTGEVIHLNPGTENRKIEACVVNLAAGPTVPLPWTNSVQVLLAHVLDGRLLLDLGGLRETLETGDCASLESDLPVSWSAAGKTGCRVLVVMPAS